MAAAVRWYLSALERWPMLTQSIMSGALFATGDVAAQQIVERRGGNHDMWRSMRLGVYGLVVAGPGIALWYRFLDRRIVLANKTAQTAARVALDQAIIAPTFLSAFLSATTLMNGGDAHDVQTTLSNNFMPVLINNYRVWPAVNCVNFYFVPLQHRLLFTNTVALFWNTYIAYVANKAHPSSAAVNTIAAE